VIVSLESIFVVLPEPKANCVMQLERQSRHVLESETAMSGMKSGLASAKPIEFPLP
jgi:hypothetical protein